MILKKLSIVNYKNIAEATLEMSPKINCFIGHNGAGKTNVLDAVYYLSFCRSSGNPVDSQLIRHDEPFFVLEGEYVADAGTDDDDVLSIYCGMKRGTKKHFKRNKKEYKRLSEHIGLIPLVKVAPGDTLLIEGTSDERRQLMDVSIAQYDNQYIQALANYNKALQQRNIMLRVEEEPNIDLLAIWEEQMAQYGEVVYEARRRFVEQLLPMFQRYYDSISMGNETVGLEYTSHCQRGSLLDVIQRDRHKDRAVGYSLHGVHRDDLCFTLSGHQMKREASQGQKKTFVIALKLAQFEMLRQVSQCSNTPLLLLDDIFDKLDADRVEQIVKLVAGDEFGQIFITDTNREHLNIILDRCSFPHRIFHVENGVIS
ncbi:MAG: DNA replication and repair protein RecF [Prevotella sp.]|nr:DNA replication and repair protein RecF [Prevotella sp.]